MGLSFRKGFKLGAGLRLNLSKRGLGISGGVKGGRVSIGPPEPKSVQEEVGSSIERPTAGEGEGREKRTKLA